MIFQMDEDTYGPPIYTDLYNFRDGAQEDIFIDSYASIPDPSPEQTVVPTPLVQPLATQESGYLTHFHERTRSHQSNYASNSGWTTSGSRSAVHVVC